MDNGGRSKRSSTLEGGSGTSRSRGSTTLSGTEADMQRYYSEQVRQDDDDSLDRSRNSLRVSGTDFTTTGVVIDQKVLSQISDNQGQYMQKRIVSVEQHFGDLCTSFAGYARSIGKVRDAGDYLAESILGMANREELNLTCKEAFTEMARHFAAMQDYREAEVRRIEDKVVKPLTAYGQVCKHSKERLREACNTRKRELKQQRALEKAKSKNPHDHRNLTKAETDLQKASMNALRADNDVEQEMQTFERKKLTDLKQIMNDFLVIELLYHSKAVELLSDCYKNLATMSEEQDLEHFLSSLRPITTQKRLKAQSVLTTAAGAMASASRSSTAAAAPAELRSGQTSSRTSNANPDRNESQRKVTYADNGDTSDEEESEEESEEEDEEQEQEDEDDEDDDSQVNNESSEEEVPQERKRQSANRSSRPVIG